MVVTSTSSFHYLYLYSLIVMHFQVLLVKDRINMEHLPIDHPIADLRGLPNTEFIPSVEDINALKEDVIQVTKNYLLS